MNSSDAKKVLSSDDLPKLTAEQIEYCRMLAGAVKSQLTHGFSPRTPSAALKVVISKTSTVKLRKKNFDLNIFFAYLLFSDDEIAQEVRKIMSKNKYGKFSVPHIVQAIRESVSSIINSRLQKADYAITRLLTARNAKAGVPYGGLRFRKDYGLGSRKI